MSSGDEVVAVRTKNKRSVFSIVVPITGKG